MTDSSSEQSPDKKDASSSIHQPHDKLFKLGFREPKHAAALLKQHLQPEFAEKIDWEKLRYEAGSFIDDELRGTETDLLFSVALLDSNSPIWIYVLVEHQSTKDPDIAIRLGEYKFRIWRKQRKENSNCKLWPILAVVVAQTATAWEISGKFLTEYKLPQEAAGLLESQLLDFSYSVIQLAQIDYAAIQGPPVVVVFIRTLKAAAQDDLNSHFVWDAELVPRMPRTYRLSWLNYLRNSKLDENEFWIKIDSINHPEVQHDAMTINQKVRQEGRQEGRLEGRQEGRQEGHLEARREAVIDNLGARFNSVPVGLIEVIDAIDSLEKLQSLQRTSATCETLEEFAEKL